MHGRLAIDEESHRAPRRRRKPSTPTTAKAPRPTIPHGTDEPSRFDAAAVVAAGAVAALAGAALAGAAPVVAAPAGEVFVAARPVGVYVNAYSPATG
jgi:hypothetical protein